MTPNVPWAVVTGGVSGIGKEVVLTLARAGWGVAVSYVHDDGHAEVLRDEVMRLGGSVAWIVRCDAGVREEVEQFFDDAQAYFGGAPKLLVNNAGIQTWSSLLELSDSNWDMVLQTNLKGCFLNTQKVARMMIASGQRGAIVNIGSGCNKIPFPNLVDYSASKAGIDQLTRSAAVELGPYGITVNCIAPGAIEIERTQRELPNYGVAWSDITPLRRVGKPSDVASAIMFLASEDASFITGQTLGVDGGVFCVPNWPR